MAPGLAQLVGRSAGSQLPSRAVPCMVGQVRLHSARCCVAGRSQSGASTCQAPPCHCPQPCTAHIVRLPTEGVDVAPAAKERRAAPSGQVCGGHSNRCCVAHRACTRSRNQHQQTLRVMAVLVAHTRPQCAAQQAVLTPGSSSSRPSLQTAALPETACSLAAAGPWWLPWGRTAMPPAHSKATARNPSEAGMGHWLYVQQR